MEHAAIIFAGSRRILGEQVEDSPSLSVLFWIPISFPPFLPLNVGTRLTASFFALVLFPPVRWAQGSFPQPQCFPKTKKADCCCLGLCGRPCACADLMLHDRCCFGIGDKLVGLGFVCNQHRPLGGHIPGGSLSSQAVAVTGLG